MLLSSHIYALLPSARIIANKYACDNLQDMIRSLKTKIEEVIRINKESMTAIYESHPYWIHHDPDAEESKIIRRALIARLLQ